MSDRLDEFRRRLEAAGIKYTTARTGTAGLPTQPQGEPQALLAEITPEGLERLAALLAQGQALPAPVLHFLERVGRLIGGTVCNQCRDERCDESVVSTCIGWNARRLLRQYGQGQAESQQAQGQAPPQGVTQTGELFPRAIQWQMAVHAATAHGTCYRTACGELPEKWAVMKAGVMSVNCPACLRALGAGAAPTPPGVTVPADADADTRRKPVTPEHGVYTLAGKCGVEVSIYLRFPGDQSAGISEPYGHHYTSWVDALRALLEYAQRKGMQPLDALKLVVEARKGEGTGD